MTNANHHKAAAPGKAAEHWSDDAAAAAVDAGAGDAVAGVDVAAGVDAADEIQGAEG